MQIRKLKPEENVHYKLMCSVCFNMSSADRYAWLEKPEDHTEGYENTWGAFDADGRLISAMVALPVEIMMNNSPAKAGLICGVTTLPEARNSRCVRKMFEIIMPQMAKDGIVYSMLYPFSFPFYRKFGYEHGFTRQRYTFPMAELARYPYPSGMKVYNKGDNWTDIAKVYTAFIQDKNIAWVRGDKEWKNILKRDPHQNREFTYIHYNATGEPDAYILYEGHVNDDDKIMYIRELAWTSKDALNAMLGFVHGLRSEYENVSWATPEGVDFFSLIDNSWNAEQKMDAIIMSRVLDVHSALVHLDTPNGEGSVAIKVTDNFLASNTGIYSVLWEDEKLCVETTNQPPDIEMDIETLAQLVTGYLTPDQAAYRKDVTIHSRQDKLSALFQKKNLYLMEHF